MTNLLMCSSCRCTIDMSYFGLNRKHEHYKTCISCRNKKRITVLKPLIWNKFIGDDIGKAKCTLCAISDITQLNFSCGHILSENNEYDLQVDNLKPICKSCKTINMNELKQTKILSKLSVFGCVLCFCFLLNKLIY